METRTSELINKTNELINDIKNLNENIIRSNSFSHIFLKGIFWGIGTAIGATMVAAIVISMLSKIIHSVNYIPIVNNLIQ